jgi:hypothetical protein
MLRQAGATASPELLRITAQWWLLETHGRLVPADAPEELYQGIDAAMLDGAPLPAANLLPGADELVLQGDRLRGGNFAYIDHLVGLDARPIAMDRQLPMLLVPLSAERATALEKRRLEYQAKPEAKMVFARWNRFHVHPVSATLAADGVAVRPYAGRTDDWYLHLVQEGTPYTQLQFFSMIESWPERAYHPITGVGTASTTPPSWFNVSDLLSHGAWSAVRAGLGSGGPLKGNPFHGFAQHVLPYCQRDFWQLQPGAELTVPPSALALARAQRRRLAPPSVAPLFRDPARFLGQLDERDEWMWVANNRGAKASASVPAVEPDLPAASPTVSEATAVQYWEDPAAAKPEPITPIPAPVPVSGQPPATTDGGIPVARAIPVKPGAEPTAKKPEEIPASSFRVAVLSPTIDEAEAYVEGIAANEAALAGNSAALQRARLFAYWAGQTAELSMAGPWKQTCEASAAAYAEKIEKLRQERMELLSARAAQQRALAGKLRNERLPELLKSLPETRGI